MALVDDLKKQVAEIFADQWTTRDGNVVPSDTSVTLGNDAVKLDATVMYADLSASTNLVDSKRDWFAAEVYKSYLAVTAKIIRSENGTVTAYDGDRVMGVFIGDSKNTSAVRAALKINWAVRNIVNPAIDKEYGADTYTVKQIVGIDTSKLFVAKTGVRGANDLVWVGRAANYAAKLSNLKTYATYITDTVHKNMADAVKYVSGDKSKDSIWNERVWTAMNGMAIYGSNGHWSM